MIARPTSPLRPIAFSQTERPPVTAPGVPTVRPSARLCATYLGDGALSVRSALTGRHYRFERQGESLFIDARDRLMLSRLPELSIR